MTMFVAITARAISNTEFDIGQTNVQTGARTIIPSIIATDISA
jgi:hypothetical protein